MEIKPELGRIAHARTLVRVGFMTLMSTLAFGEASIDAPAAGARSAWHDGVSGASALASSVPTNESFGLSGADVSGGSESLQNLSAFRSLSGPNSRFPNSNLRLLVHDGDIVGAERQINTGLAYSKQYQDYSPQSAKPAPEIITTTIDNKDVQVAAKGRDLCDRNLPTGKPLAPPNPQFNLKKCESTALALEAHTLRALMGKYTMIRYWTAQNEPEDLKQPSSRGEGGPAFAVKEWLLANKIARSLHNNQQVVPGEFWVFPGTYEHQYFSLLSQDIKAEHLAMPSAVALHMYRVVDCSDFSLLSAELSELKQLGMYKSIQQGAGVFGTESGLWLGSSLRCPNALAMSNGSHYNTARLSAEALSNMAAAQLLAAYTALNIGGVDPTMHFLQDMYDVQSPSYKGWSGGNWDSAWFFPQKGSVLPDGTGQAGFPRIPYYVMTNQPVPDWMLHPKTLAQMQADELALIPAVNWTGSRPGDLAFGKVIDH